MELSQLKPPSARKSPAKSATFLSEILGGWFLKVDNAFHLEHRDCGFLSHVLLDDLVRIPFSAFLLFLFFFLF